MNEKEFNQNYPVGTPVHYYPIAGVDDYVCTKTRSEAWELGSGYVVVSVSVGAGGVSANHIQPCDCHECFVCGKRVTHEDAHWCHEDYCTEDHRNYGGCECDLYACPDCCPDCNEL